YSIGLALISQAPPSKILNKLGWDRVAAVCHRETWSELVPSAGISFIAAFCAFRPGISVLKTDARPVPPSQRSKGNFPLMIWPSHFSGATAVFMRLLVSVFYLRRWRFQLLGWK